MSVVVVTRFRVAQPRHVAPFLLWSIRCAAQARATHGALRVELFAEAVSIYWTLTQWQRGRDLVAFRDSGPHAESMARTGEWASEAALVRWQHRQVRPPRLGDVGDHLDAVQHLTLPMPSNDHLAGRFEVPSMTRTRLVVPLRRRGRFGGRLGGRVA